MTSKKNIYTTCTITREGEGGGGHRSYPDVKVNVILSILSQYVYKKKNGTKV